MAKMEDAVCIAAVNAYIEYGSQRLAADALGIAQSSLNVQLKEAKVRGLYREPSGAAEVFESIDYTLPAKGKVKRYFLTCAQDHTKLNRPAWLNMQALADHYRDQKDSDGVEILVSTFNYNKDAVGQSKSAKGRDEQAELAANFPREVVPFICNDRINLTKNLTFVGEVQISPTARRPLTGFENYTYRRSTIIPHTTIALASVPGMHDEGVKLLYTTGTMTQRNYIKRRVGFQAEHYHAYGFLLVEVDSDGHWWCRQVQHGADGAMHDLNIRVKAGDVQVQTSLPLGRNHKSFVADIAWGDTHASQVDPVVADIQWGKRPDSMLEFLHPASQHVHDLLDFSPQSHHTRRDPHLVYRHFVKTRGSVTTELLTTAKVANEIYRDWCDTVVVNSNHDRHPERWLKEADWRDDHENAILILDLNSAILKAIQAGDDNFYLPEMMLKLSGANPKIRFLREDESDIILGNIDGGIEAGLHGDRGANGAKGTVSGIARSGRKYNIADKHAAAIMDLTYCAGTSGRLKMGFNHGLTTWTHADIVTYRNGTRAIVSVWKGKYKA